MGNREARGQLAYKTSGTENNKNMPSPFGRVNTERDAAVLEAAWQWILHGEAEWRPRNPAHDPPLEKQISDFYTEMAVLDEIFS